MGDFILYERFVAQGRYTDIETFHHGQAWGFELSKLSDWRLRCLTDSEFQFSAGTVVVELSAGIICLGASEGALSS